MKPAVARGVSSPPTPAPSRTEALAAAWKAYYQRVGHEAPRHPAAKDFMDRDLAQALGRMVPNDASVLEVGCGAGDLLASLPNRVRVGVDMRPEVVAEARQRHPGLQFAVAEAPAMTGESIPDRFDAIICDRLVHSVLDVRALLRGLGERLTPDGRMFLTAFNYLWEVPTRLAEGLGWKVPAPTSNWLSASDFQNLFDMAGLEVVRFDDRLMLPLPIPGLDVALNRYLVKLPVLNLSSLYRIYVLRKRRGPATRAPGRAAAVAPKDKLPTVTVVVPARNEAGNVDQAVTRTPVMGGGTELIFVEGGSSDGTWERIQEVMGSYQGPLKLAAYKQMGKGKGDAVRLGFGKATGDLLMILDADLTVPPEDLPVFYEAAVDGYADYLQGTRLVYPMEAGAMRFFNKLGNIAFSRLFTHLLQQPIKDTLCGTKVLWRRDYERIAANRHVFGDFDPFGDFDLIFGAARLNLKLGEIPVRYRDRVYGETNIQRWKHGWLLLKMSALAARKLRYV
jgi:2-polyprenyl-3-methyl-5-hydroxy-6-metoxy-1,4-benzoquinol methylase